MSPALWGLMTALGWGSADFIARFTGRTVGYQLALLGMLSAGAVVLTVMIGLGDFRLVWDPSGWWAVLVTGVGTMAATLRLYRELPTHHPKCFKFSRRTAFASPYLLRFPGARFPVTSIRVSDACVILRVSRFLISALPPAMSTSGR